MPQPGAATARRAGAKGHSTTKLEFISLPDYSTERYYLLSEIEENSDEMLCFDDEGFKLKPVQICSSKNRIVVHYITWDMSQGWERLEATVRGYMSECGEESCLSQYCIVAIEAIYHSSDYSAVMVKNAVSLAMSSLQGGLLSAAGCIVFGISNNTVAAPALDVINDHMSAYDLSNIQWAMATAQRTHFLGNATLNLNPEAVGNVSQQYVSSKPLSNYLQSTFGLKESAKPSPTENRAAAVSAPQRDSAVPADLIRMQAILVAFLAFLLYYVYSDRR